VQIRECPQVERCLQGGQSGDLHADDPRAADRYVGMHEDRSDSQRGGKCRRRAGSGRRVECSSGRTYDQFAGYSSDSLAERILDSRAKVLITTDGVWRGEKLLLLKNICDEALSKVQRQGHRLESCVVVAHLRRLNNPQGRMNGLNGTGNSNGNANITWDDDRDVWWHDEMEDAEPSCYPVWMSAEDPLFILYTR